MRSHSLCANATRRGDEGIIKAGFPHQRIAPHGDATFGRARRRRGRATLKHFEDPPPSPSIRLGAQGLGIGLECTCRGSHPSVCYVVFLGFCRAGGLAVHGWLTAAASLGWSVETQPSNTCSHERPQRRRNVKAQRGPWAGSITSQSTNPKPGSFSSSWMAL